MSHFKYSKEKLFIENISVLSIAKKNKTLDQISLEELKKFYKDLDKNVLKVFNVRHSMNSKNSYGGTSSSNVKKMIKKYRKNIK